MIQEIGFAPDTAVEGNGFERLVPRKTPGVLFGIGSVSGRPTPEGIVLSIALMAPAVANWLVAALMFMASGSMGNCKSHGLARLGSMLALLPLNPFVVVTFPIGLWALRALQKPEVKAAFGLPADESN